MSVIWEMTPDGEKRMVQPTYPLLSTPTEDTIDAACRLHERAVAAQAAGDYAHAAAWGLQALTILEQAVGSNHPDVANVLTHLAEVYAGQQFPDST